MTLHDIFCEMLMWYIVGIATLPILLYSVYNLIDSLIWKYKLMKEQETEMRAEIAYYERGGRSGH